MQTGNDPVTMRIGLFTEVYHPVVNGVVASLDALTAGLRSLGHDVYCFTPRMPGYDEADGPVYRLPSLPLPVQTAYRLTVPVVTRKRRHAVLERLDVLHAHSPFVTGWMAARYARRLHIPLVYTYHTRLEEYVHYVPFEANAARRAASRLTRNFANGADAVIVPTPAMRQRLLDLGVTASIDVIPSGIEIAQFAAAPGSAELRASLGLRGGERMLLFVSRLAKEKNVDLLIDAFALTATPLRLIVVGAGPAREALEQTAHSRGLAGRIVFAGPVDRERLPAYYGAADAFVFPSMTETQGLVLAEALAAGTLVIAADAPQNREVLGGAGTVVPAQPEAFAAAMDAVPVQRDPAAASLARAAAARFDVAGQAVRVAAVYERLTRTYVRCTIPT